MTSSSTEGRLLGAALVAFVALLGTSMLCYPGGDCFDASGTHYRFWQNFLCDLLLVQAMNGQPNLDGSILATLAAFLLMVFGLTPLWWRTRTWQNLSRIAGVLSTAFSLLMCAQVIFDLPITHAVVTLLFGGFGVMASFAVFLDSWRDPATPATVAWTGALALASAVGGAILYGCTKWGGMAAMHWLPGVQKVVMILALLWLAAVASDLSSRRGSLRVA